MPRVSRHLAELAYAVKWTWLDYWRWGYALNSDNFNMNRGVWRATYAKGH